MKYPACGCEAKILMCGLCRVCFRTVGRWAGAQPDAAVDLANPESLAVALDGSFELFGVGADEKESPAHLPRFVLVVD